MEPGFGRGTEENKKAPKDGAEKRYSISENLKEDLEKVKNGTFQSKRNEVYIGETSKFLEEVIGVKPLSVTMPENKAYSAMATEDEAKNDTNHKYNKNTNYHGLGVDGLFELLVDSENPLIAFVDIDESGKTDRYDRIVLVTGKKVNNGLGIVVTKVSAGALVHGKSVTVNKTITVFDRKQIAIDFSRAFLDGRLLYVDEKRSQTLSSVLGANYQGTLRGIDFNKNIQQFWNNVNKKRGEFISQTPKKTKKRHSIGRSEDAAYLEAVKRGDIEAAQEMVDEAAKAAGYDTQKLYHGGPSGIREFITKNPMGTGGLYLSSNKSVAEVFAGNNGTVYSLYANLKNPYEINANAAYYDSEKQECREGEPAEFPTGYFRLDQSAEQKTRVDRVGLEAR